MDFNLESIESLVEKASQRAAKGLSKAAEASHNLRVGLGIASGRPVTECAPVDEGTLGVWRAARARGFSVKPERWSPWQVAWFAARRASAIGKRPTLADALAALSAQAAVVAQLREKKELDGRQVARVRRHLASAWLLAATPSKQISLVELAIGGASEGAWLDGAASAGAEAAASLREHRSQLLGIRSPKNRGDAEEEPQEIKTEKARAEKEALLDVRRAFAESLAEASAWGRQIALVVRSLPEKEAIAAADEIAKAFQGQWDEVVHRSGVSRGAPEAALSCPWGQLRHVSGVWAQACESASRQAFEADFVVEVANETFAQSAEAFALGPEMAMAVYSAAIVARAEQEKEAGEASHEPTSETLAIGAQNAAPADAPKRLELGSAALDAMLGAPNPRAIALIGREAMGQFPETAHSWGSVAIERLSVESSEFSAEARKGLLDAARAIARMAREGRWEEKAKDAEREEALRATEEKAPEDEIVDPKKKGHSIFSKHAA
jgi:hypothetical protein